MDEWIENFVSRKLRKQGKQYNLSANSILAGQDFSYANKIASKIYAMSKSILPNIGSHSLFHKLLKQASILQRADEVHEFGQLRIGYGNIQTFRDFQFNPKRSWSSFVPWPTKIVYNTDDGLIKITVPTEKNWSKENYHHRTSRLAIKYYVLKIPFELSEEVALLATKKLLLKPGEQSVQKEASFALSDWDDCLVLVIGSIRSYFWNTDGQTEYLTNNKSFMAASILNVFGLRGGTLVQDRVIEISQAPTPEPDEGVDWH